MAKIPGPVFALQTILQRILQTRQPPTQCNRDEASVPMVTSNFLNTCKSISSAYIYGAESSLISPYYRNGPVPDLHLFLSRKRGQRLFLSTTKKGQNGAKYYRRGVTMYRKYISDLTNTGITAEPPHISLAMKTQKIAKKYSYIP